MKRFLQPLLVGQLVLCTFWAQARDARPIDKSANGGSNSAITLQGSLVTFHAAAGRNCFNLTWNASSLPGCDHFEVERSLDGLHFQKMGDVKVNVPEGEAAAYNFQDNIRPTMARNNDFYYRLRQVDGAGQISYSKILIARVYNTHSLASLSVTPDPSVNDILVNVQLKENSFVVMKITDKDGNQILRKAEKLQGGMSTHQLEGSNSLTPGTYMLEIIVNSNERLNIKLEKA